MITKAALLEDLGRAGIDPHGMLLCHFSMKKIGPVENGADTVLDALMEYMKNGLLIVPCHTWSNVNDENPVFDVRETKPCVGLLPDVSLLPGFRRCNFPVLFLFGRLPAAFSAPDTDGQGSLHRSATIHKCLRVVHRLPSPASRGPQE